MKKELETTYDPGAIEERLYQKWLDNKYFHAEVDETKQPYTIVIPPPNITGKLHMGHALDETLQDILIRYKDLKRIYGYKIKDYWRNIASVDDYYSTNMDFLKADVRNYFFKQYPDVYSKVDDLPPAKYNPGSQVRNSLVSSGCIVNGVVENSVIFKKSYIGNNCVIKNSIILNDVYIGDNTHIENCIVESRDTIRANSYFVGEGEVKIVVERNERYVI